PVSRHRGAAKVAINKIAKTAPGRRGTAELCTHTTSCQPNAAPKVMSASPPKADMCSALADVCFGPIADIAASNVTREGSKARGRSVRGDHRDGDPVASGICAHCL